MCDKKKREPGQNVTFNPMTFINYCLVASKQGDSKQGDSKARSEKAKPTAHR